MTDKPLNPTAWLWLQLDVLLTPETLAALRIGFAAQSKRYNHASIMRMVRREIMVYERIIIHIDPESKRAASLRKSLAARREKLARLEAEAASDES